MKVYYRPETNEIGMLLKLAVWGWVADVGLGDMTFMLTEPSEWVLIGKL